MQKLFGWLIRAPFWVWLLLPASSLFFIGVALGRVGEIERSLEHVENLELRVDDGEFRQPLAKFREVLEGMRRSAWLQLALAAVGLLASARVAVWRWRAGRFVQSTHS